MKAAAPSEPDHGQTSPRRLTLADIGARTFDVVERGVCYRLKVPGAELEFEIDRLTWHRQELAGELLVRCAFLGTQGCIDGVLSVAAFNVSSARARAERATYLARQANAADLPWAALLEELCQRVLTAERSGETATPLRDVERPDESDRLVNVSGFLLPREHPACLFGDGGTMKSYLSLYLAGRLAEDGYRVGLFDWELDASDHRARYERLFGEAMPAALFYVRCARPLIHEVDGLKRVARLQGLDYGIFDSVGFATHEPPEKSESALAYFQAVRAIGIGSLHIAHVNKSETGDMKPYGSAFWHNSCRATWFVKASDDTNPLTLGIFQRKANLNARQAPFAIEATFGDRTSFNLVDIGAVTDFAGQVPLAQRLRALLTKGGLTRDEIASALDGEKPDTLRRTLNRAIEKGHLIRFPGPGGQERIGLPERRSA